MKFTLQRDKVVATIYGHSIEFKKGVATHVPPTCYAAVLAIGAVPDEDLSLDKPKVPAAPQGEERKALIKAAMKEMVLAADRESFTASGVPHTSVLAHKLGFPLHAKERDEVWVELNTAEE